MGGRSVPPTATTHQQPMSQAAIKDSMNFHGAGLPPPDVVSEPGASQHTSKVEGKSPKHSALYKSVGGPPSTQLAPRQANKPPAAFLDLSQ